MTKQIAQVDSAAANVYNPNLLHLEKAYSGGKSGALLEGSSRSGKTFSELDFHIWFSSVHEGKTINIIRETHRSFDTTLYEDINRRFPQFGIPSPFEGVKTVVNFKLFGNQWNFLGADNQASIVGVGSDVTWYNEMLDVPKWAFDQTEMRCRMFWSGDYNPKSTNHYVFDNVALRPDVALLQTTFLDNPYISKGEKRKILSYEPTHPDDRKLIPSKRRPHPTNITNGTADDYMWNVYGLGLRSSPEGLIFQHVNWIDKFPDNVERQYYGNDYGWENNPTTIVRVGVSGKDMYLEKVAYGPTASVNQYFPMLDALPKGYQLVADPGGGGSGMISEARRHGYKILSANKFAGSILYGIGIMKGYRIHIVDCPEWRREQANYKRRVVNGTKMDEPVDAFNDLWDAARYVALTWLRGT